jgi:hypothetical protein
MGFDDDGDPPIGQKERTVDTAEVRMDIEETTEAVVGHMAENPGRTSL